VFSGKKNPKSVTATSGEWQTIGSFPAASGGLRTLAPFSLRSLQFLRESSNNRDFFQKCYSNSKNKRINKKLINEAYKQKMAKYYL